MMPVLVTSNFLDGIQCVLSSNASGCGWQKIGSFVNLGAYYLIGIPSSLLFAFVLHVRGKAKKAYERVYDSTIPIEITSCS
ncbi:hypothetical protein GIB67_028467 [Kingdonia uniflora]|uniref:Uncharacterized protein n=1 Tax=Kingdonia uniflora TaxID=39325 RepID=A0A7J7P145_9MAGN|nr:hypothetical protein GIB67_028467 [Kingdonia uniflora]